MRRYFLNFKESGGGFYSNEVLHSNDLIGCAGKPKQIVMLRDTCWPTQRDLHRGAHMGAHKGVLGGKERYM